MVLSFVLGNVATWLRSDIEFPEAIYKFLGIYLLMAIGLSGGVELGNTSFGEFWRPALATAALAIAVPLGCYGVLRSVGRFDVANAAGVAALYGSVSSVTFIASTSLMQGLGVPYEGFIPSLAVLMEWGLVVALFVGRWQLGAGASLAGVVRDVLTGRSVVLLLGFLLIGLTIGDAGYAAIKPVFGDLFRGVLVIFLFEMGMVAGRQVREFARVGVFMVGFGIAMPLLQGVVGVTLGSIAGLSLGGSFILGAITASASYIDAPAAVRTTFPQANPGIYLTASLGVTFPFNLTIGLPLYFEYAKWLHSTGGFA
jgi:hypothetical protein